MKITANKIYTENGKKTGKSFAFNLDPKEMAIHSTLATVKKKVEEYILKGGVFHQEDLKDLKYQGLDEFMKEWKQNRETVEKEIAAGGQTESSPIKEYDLERFVIAQDPVYEDVVEELTEGRKTGHWIWFIFPQQKGLGHSPNSEYYGLDGLDEAKAYLEHPVLSERLRECCQLLLTHAGKRSVDQIMGSGIDVLKLQTSMNLFNHVSPDDIFLRVLEELF